MDTVSSTITAIFTAIATIISLVSLCIGLINEIKRKEIEEKQNSIKMNLSKLEHGKAEIQINQLISDAKKNVLDISLKIHDENYSTKDKDLLMDIYNSYIELELCAYDEACSLYIDEKIDTERFKKNYQTEIRRLFENKDTKERLNPIDSKFHCLRRVYQEWENPENK